MTLRDYLAGRDRPRANPADPPPGWCLWVRGPDESPALPWELRRAGLGSVEDARAELVAPAGLFAAGELARIDRAPGGGAPEHWVVGPDGVGSPLPFVGPMLRDVHEGAGSRALEAWAQAFRDDWWRAWRAAPRGAWLVAMALAAGADPGPVLDWAAAELRDAARLARGRPRDLADQAVKALRGRARRTSPLGETLSECSLWTGLDRPTEDDELVRAAQGLLDAAWSPGGRAWAKVHDAVERLATLEALRAGYTRGGVTEALPSLDAARAQAEALRGRVPFGAVADALERRLRGSAR